MAKRARVSLSLTPAASDCDSKPLSHGNPKRSSIRCRHKSKKFPPNEESTATSSKHGIQQRLALCRLITNHPCSRN